MTPAELIAACREEHLDDLSDQIGDPESGAAFGTKLLLRWACEAQREACMRRDLKHLYDETTAEICEIALSSGERSYPLDARILRIEDAYLDGSPGESLSHTSIARLDAERPWWRESGIGTPRRFAIAQRTLVLDPPPSSGTLRLRVWRLPLSDPGMTEPFEWTDAPEKLAHWIAHRAFMRPNGSLGVPTSAELAGFHAAQFAATFGPALSAEARAGILAYPPALSVGPGVPVRRAAGYRW